MIPGYVGNVELIILFNSLTIVARKPAHNLNAHITV